MENLPEKNGQRLQDLQELALKYRFTLIILLLGLILIGFGAFFVKNGLNASDDKVEVLNNATTSSGGEIFVEVGGAVEKPGVYKFRNGVRVDDALVMAGGLSANADRSWVEKTVNRASKLTDGQKIYIPPTDQQSQVSSATNSTIDQSVSSTLSTPNTGRTNINNASMSLLDQLPGISPIYAQKIIDQRPYSNIEELLSEKVLPKSTYEKIKNLIAVY